MLSRRILLVTAGLFVATAALFPLRLAISQGEQKELVAVIDLDAAGATKIQAAALSDRLREELLATGRFRIVERGQMDKLLAEQALQQTGCTSQECAVQVGKVLGVRKMISGKASKIEDDLWLISCTLTDVETAETVKAVSLQHEGSFRSVLADGAAQLVAKLTEGVAAGRPVSKTGEAMLEVLNVPPDAEVFLNGASKGRGPQRFEKLVPGEYEIAVKRKGYRPWRRSAPLAAGAAGKVEFVSERFKVAMFPLRRTGTWQTQPESTYDWVSRAAKSALTGAGLAVAHGSHPNLGDKTLQNDADAEKNTWKFLGGADEEFLRGKGKALGDDLAVALAVDAGTAGRGTWLATIVDVATGKAESERGFWPWSPQAGPELSKGVEAFLAKYMAAIQP
jgi:hypothetical protein